MGQTNFRTGAGTVAMALVLFTAGCGSTVELQSVASTDPVIVDGSTAEWSGHLTRIENGRASIGVQHDDENVYVAFITRDPATLRSMLRSGFIVWFDNEGGKTHRFGVRFPLGRLAMAEGRGGRPPMPGGIPPDPSMESSEGGPIDLIPADGIPERFAPDGAEGIRVRATMDMASVVYEIAVSRRRITADGALSDVIGVGFESPKLDSGPQGPDAATAAAGGNSGRRGRRGGGGGGMGDLAPAEGGGPGREAVASFEIWTKVAVLR